MNPGTLPVKVTTTELKAVDNALEISGTTQRLTLGGATPVTSRWGQPDTNQSQGPSSSISTTTFVISTSRTPP